MEPMYTSTRPSHPSQQMQEVLDQLARLGGEPIEHLSPQAARQQPTPSDAVTALLRQRGNDIGPEPVALVENRSIPGPGGEIAIRIYTPGGIGPFPVVLYIHGGGWVIADLDVYDASPRAIANAAGAIVVSTHYRLAPEHPFPAAHDDTFAAYLWVRQNAALFQGDPQRIAVAGESAGGNMAAALCLTARHQQVPLPVHQVLVYPVASAEMKTPSFRENAEAKPLNQAMFAWFGGHAFRNPEDTQDPRIDLLNADLRGLPPTTIITAQIDPLRSGGEMLADKLHAAGVAVHYRCFDGVTHEFFGMGAVLRESRDATEFVANHLKSSFEPAIAAHDVPQDIPRRPPTDRPSAVVL